MASYSSSSSSSLGDKQLQRIIRDLRDAVLELSKEHKECLEPVTDDSGNLHKFFYKLEYLLQFDQKEKTTFLGQRKDYWDYFCDCLIKIKGANDGIRFVKSIPELKTSLGKGRAFIRYSLVHQRLADTLQQCLINQKVTSDWYYSRSPFLKSHLTADIINHLYELNQIQFDVAARGYDLDADWPKFARRTLGSGSAAYLWKPPSRCSSINSLVSTYSHTQVHVRPTLLSHCVTLTAPDQSFIAEDLRVELDKSELRQQELLVQIQELGKEAAELKAVVRDLQGQLSAQKSNVSAPAASQSDRGVGDEERINQLQSRRDFISTELQDRLTAAEHNNMELLSKLDEALKEKGQQAASFCDSAWKIQELVDKLKTVEEERLQAKTEAEDRTRHSERLSQELKLREEELRSTEEQLAQVKAGARDEREEALSRLEELQSAVGRIQGALTLKEKESGNLRAQLQDLQASLECRERQAEELRKKLQEEREKVEQTEEHEGLIATLQKTLKQREKELAASSERNKDLEEKLEKMNAEKETLSSGLDGEEHQSLEDYRSQCSSLAEANAHLLQAVRRSEETIAELTQSRAAMLEQLASLKASENHLRARVDATGLCVEEREKKLSDENQRLEEALQKMLTSVTDSDVKVKRLEQENQELREIHSLLKERAFTGQQEVDSLNTKADNLEKNLAASQRSQAELLEKLQESEAKLREQTLRCSLLQDRVEELESRTRDAHDEKGAAESNEKLQKLHQEPPDAAENKDANIRLVIAQAQLELNLREVTRLHDEVLELRAQLLAGSEEKMKVQALQEVTEASREDLRLLVEQLKAQVEDLNRRHVDEILRSREREEALVRERDGEAQARAGLAAEVTTSREELDKQKLRYEASCVENSELREALHRANTETAELGVHVCMLTAENEEARLRWEGLSSRLQELEEEAAQEAERLNTRMEKLCQENQDLHSRLRDDEEQSLQSELSQARLEIRAAQEASSEEVLELRSQLSRQTECHHKELQVSACSTREVSQKYYVFVCCRQIEEKNIQMVDCESLIRQKEDEIIRLKGNLSRSEEGLKVAERACQELDESLRRLAQDRKSIDLKTAAELDDLYRTKINLEERLIELIRDKDALWQKSDALEFEQKLRDEDAERNFCSGCHTQFSWWLRKYSCSLCGRPFCYYCCGNAVSTQQGGGTERCCRDCYTQHSAVVERHPQGDQDRDQDQVQDTERSTPGTPLRTDEGEKLDDGVFDIITEEEVSGVQVQDSPCGACGIKRGGCLSTSSELWRPILKCPAFSSLASHFTVEDISGFGDGSRELFVKSNCYSTVHISMRSAGPTVCWTFTSEPKSISFSVVFRDGVDTPLEQAKVLIPLTRCNSHKETIQGEMKVRNPGEYTLIFDNSFSRFISKRVLYQLSLDRPVVYDGSDFL
uniref:FYVE and coiled-coil domain containing 1b n=1 Tax=Salarias fasciatus TaxID=181472 RepID=A0A672G791_SALFA